MKPSELLLKALEYERFDCGGMSVETRQFYSGIESENSHIISVLRDSGVLDVLDAADEVDELEPSRACLENLWEKQMKLRERLGGGK